MSYILPSGVYYDASPHVAEGSIECAPRPENCVLADDWQTDPMNPATCWRAKTAAEVLAETTDSESRFEIPEPFMVIAKVLHKHENWQRVKDGKATITLAQFIKGARQL